MKIKLIIIVFSISCLFFPAQLMEAEAVPIPSNLIKRIIHEAIQLGEKAPAKGPGGSIGLQGGSRGVGKLCQENQELCTGNDKIMYKELSFDKYGIKSLQIPSSWETYPAIPETYCDGVACDVILSFADGATKRMASAKLMVIYPDPADDGGTTHEVEFAFDSEPKMEFQDLKALVQWLEDESPFMSGMKIIESEGPILQGIADRQMVKYTKSEKDWGGIGEEVVGKIVLIQEESFAYIFWFENEQSEFALNAELYDHIVNTFVTSHQSFWQNVLGLIAIIIAIGLIIAFVARRNTSSKKSKKMKRKGMRTMDRVPTDDDIAKAKKTKKSYTRS